MSRAKLAAKSGLKIAECLFPKLKGAGARKKAKAK
jgi:hypothetical protein